MGGVANWVVKAADIFQGRLEIGLQTTRLQSSLQSRRRCTRVGRLHGNRSLFGLEDDTGEQLHLHFGRLRQHGHRVVGDLAIRLRLLPLFHGLLSELTSRCTLLENVLSKLP